MKMFGTPVYKQYQSVVKQCLSFGDTVVSRVGPMAEWQEGRTKEFTNLQYHFTPGDEVYRPGYSRRLAWTEALHLLSGSFDPSHFATVSPKAMGMFTAAMAYGPRVMPSIPRVCAELREHPDSRRAVVFISDNGAATSSANRR